MKKKDNFWPYNFDIPKVTKKIETSVVIEESIQEGSVNPQVLADYSGKSGNIGLSGKSGNIGLSGKSGSNNVFIGWNSGKNTITGNNNDTVAVS